VTGQGSRLRSQGAGVRERGHGFSLAEAGPARLGSSTHEIRPRDRRMKGRTQGSESSVQRAKRGGGRAAGRFHRVEFRVQNSEFREQSFDSGGRRAAGGLQCSRFKGQEPGEGNRMICERARRTERMEGDGSSQVRMPISEQVRHGGYTVTGAVAAPCAGWATGRHCADAGMVGSPRRNVWFERGWRGDPWLPKRARMTSWNCDRVWKFSWARSRSAGRSSTWRNRRCGGASAVD